MVFQKFQVLEKLDINTTNIYGYPKINNLYHIIAGSFETSLMKRAGLALEQ